MSTPTPTGYTFLDGTVKDFADVFALASPAGSGSQTTGYKSVAYGNLDLGEIFTAGSNTIVTKYYSTVLGSVDLGSIFAPPTMWSTLEPGWISSGDYVNSIAIDSLNRVYVGGSFAYVDSIQVNGIAMWTPGTPGSWSALGSGVAVDTTGSSNVFTIAIDSLNRVYVGGLFPSAGGVSNTNLIALWIPGTPGSWYPVGVGFTGSLILSVDIISILSSNSNVYVGGNFLQVYNGSTAVSGTKNLARWTPSVGTGGTWSSVGGGITSTGTGTSEGVSAIAFDNLNNVYVGGSFTEVKNSGTPFPVHKIAMWNGSVWSSVGNGVSITNPDSYWGYSSVFGIAIDNLNNVYVGGDFVSTYDNISNTKGLAMWNGSAWSSVGNGLTNTGYVYVYTIVLDTSFNIYVGGNFTQIDGINAGRIAKYENLNWNTLEGGVSGGSQPFIGHLESNGLTVYVGGDFTTAGTITANKIAVWN